MTAPWALLDANPGWPKWDELIERVKAEDFKSFKENAEDLID